MKRNDIARAIVAVAMACTLGACGNKPADTATTEPETQVTEEQAVETDVVEDGQNPVMNVIGPYACDNANILIEANGLEGARATVMWADSATETTKWEMVGSFDEKTLTITYDNCTKTKLTYAEDGSLDTEEDVYTDGTGTFTFTDTDDGTELTWDDAKEHVADGMTFKFNF
ncbi:MAG: hypothetical protein J6D34_09370 [Atopobiaceae bacterium]|nr:hypothetical protein [Atopobiaceae bacterium]